MGFEIIGLQEVLLKYYDHTEVAVAYTRLLQELSPSRSVNGMQLSHLCSRKHERLLFACGPGRALIGTAQASYSYPGGQHTVTISNVIVTESWQGHGVGKRLVQTLIEEAPYLWRVPRGETVNFELTSQPWRDTLRFYTTLGFTMRGSTDRYRLSVEHQEHADAH